MNEALKFPWPLRLAGWLRHPLRKPVQGFVEAFEADAISGWAFDRRGTALRLELRVGRAVIALEPAWTSRRDVALVHGRQYEMCGFVCRISANDRRSLQREMRRGEAVAVLANGLPLKLRALPAPPAEMESLDIAFRTPGGCSGALQAYGLFALRGWAAQADGSPADVALLCNGAPATVPVHRCSATAEPGRTDPGAAAATGFVIELPPALWRSGTAVPGIRLGLQVGGEVVEQVAIDFGPLQVGNWIRRLCGADEIPERQALLLLALEHVREARMLVHLGAQPAQQLLLFARPLHLEPMIADQLAAEPGAEYAESTSELLLRDAMRRLNELLIVNGTQSAVLPSILAVLQEGALAQEARTWYLHLATQLCSETGEFEQLKPHIRLQSILELRNNQATEHLCLALPALASEGMMLDAIQVMRRLRSQLHQGWLHTGCIRYAIRRVQELEIAGEVEPEPAERLRWEFLRLLDEFHGDWFSRLHDVGLIDTLIHLLGDMERYADHLREDLVGSAMRHFALSPVFWERLEQAGVQPQGRLGRARSEWHAVREAVETWPAVRAKLVDGDGAAGERWLLALLEPLQWLQRRGNREAVYLLREALANLLPHADASSPAARAAVQLLLLAEETDAVRIAAFPAPAVTALADAALEHAERMPSLLRQVSDTPSSPVLMLQQHLAGELAAFEREQHSPQCLARVVAAAVRLSDWNGGFLCVDAWAYALVAWSGQPAQALAMCARLAQAFLRSIEGAERDYYLPAPALAGLWRLRSHRAGSAMGAVVAEAMHALRSRFGDAHADALREPAALALSCTALATGLCADTLIVRVYASQDAHADLQDQAQDAGAGVAWLTLRQAAVEEFADGVLGVVEDPAGIAGMLRLFRWVLDNTDAQYVVWLDSGCYLDLERFLGVLSYRKHHYYGRLVRVGPGAMEREYLLPDGTAALDRSPEPSEYADGRFAFSLSRQAVALLLRSAASVDGQRLIGVSRHADKLLGDLLAMARIGPSSEDYEIYEQQEITRGALPITRGGNTFLPCSVAPTLAAVFAPGTTAMTTAARLERDLLPKKIWPTCWRVSIGHDANQLELLTEPAQARRLQAGDGAAVVAVMRNEMLMLPHFLEHYRRLGAGCFMIADNCSDDGTREYLYEQPDVILYSADTQYRRSHYGVAWQQAMLGNACLGRWVIVADADEFLVYEDCESVGLAELCRRLEQERVDGCLVHMIDMYPFGDLDSARFDRDSPFVAAPCFDATPQIELMFGGGHFGNSRNFVNALRHRIAPSRINAYVSQKYALFRYKPWMRFSEGLHYAANLRCSATPLCFAHFKYHAGFKHKVMTEVRRKQHFNGAEEYKRYAGLLAEGQGSFGRDGVSATYHASASFAAWLGADAGPHRRGVAAMPAAAS